MKRKITWEEVFIQLKQFDLPNAVVYGVPKGGMILTAFLKEAKVTHNPKEATLILDDVVDSGNTWIKYRQMYPHIEFAVLFDKSIEGKDVWLEFPWETDHPGTEDSVDQNIIRILQYVGEDTTREGLVDTPKRVIKSYGELYAGYRKDPKELLTVFDVGTYDQIVLLKNVELYSMCEHHMLPFIGRAHVAYLPDKKVIGISKLARLVDMFARRLQIQERIGEQITTALMEHLQPKGAACIIEAQHLCMQMRGVAKQNSVMVTSSMKGAFKDNLTTRQELLNLIK
jgi:GTP cyclohydrolase I